MRVLVTGGAGFIGSYLVRALVEQGDEVVVFDCMDNPTRLDAVRSRITYVQGDAASETELYRVMATHGIEGVLHLGALLAGACERNPLKAFDVNVRSTLVLLDAAVALHVRRFFLMSSISLFSPSQSEPVPENAPKEPTTLYGVSKLSCEHLMRWYACNHGLDVRGLRPTWVWGPNRTNGLTATYTTGLVDAIARGGTVHVANPDERGDWIYIHDTIKAILLIWNAKTTAQQFYTACGSVHTLREVAEIARKYCPETTVTYAAEGQCSSPYAAAFDDSALRTELGYVPDYSIEASVRDYIQVVMKKAL